MRHWPFLPDFIPIVCPECGESASWAYFRAYHNGVRVEEVEAEDDDRAEFLCHKCGHILWHDTVKTLNSYFLGKEADARSPNLRNGGDAVRLET